jgi:N-acyl amino acid synthase of PEP-CTERM/exosortase system
MVSANTDELKKEVYKLRYQVYCIETGFLNSEDYPDGLEIDDFDQQSVHYLIRHRNSGDYAGTTRLILPDHNNPEKLLPFELHCKIDNVSMMQPINRRYLGEVSRLCVSKAFKKRKNEAQTLAGINAAWQPDNFTANERRSFPHIAIGLAACFIKASYENDIFYLFGAMEPSFFRFVSLMGINLIKMGPLVDYHGDRGPAAIKITDLLNSVAEKNLDMWNLLTNNGQIKFTHT